MPSIEHALSILAPPVRVFHLLADAPERVAEWWTFYACERVDAAPTALGHIWRYSFSIMGVRVRGEQQVIEYVPDERIAFRTLTGLDCLWTYSLMAEEGGCTLTLAMEYVLPGSILGQKIHRKAIEQRLHDDLGEALLHLKMIAETDL